MLKFVIIFSLIALPKYGNAQTLGATDTSDKSVQQYKSVIQNNRDIVDFIEYSLQEKGLPRHLKNLALIESGFNSGTISSAGAKGVWQFMVPHANQYGLTEKDRSDIYRSTKAAVNSLGNLYKKYGNWITVVAAYNCGEGNIQKAMNKAGSKKYTDFYPYLSNETINHVQKYLNASYASGELSEVLSDYYGMEDSNNLETSYKEFVPEIIDFNISTTQINSGYNLGVIAKFLKIPTEELLELNENLITELNETGEGTLHLSNDLMTTFTLNQDEILNQSLKNSN
ncbi:lytic transglycosylase domain-containing protein [Chishuiella sp.]|uniref:lytic transglycosylase domain-containing protein n=1 Tax=Chishuiella sp. TaxID=1969467 RepID=UPI0028AB77C0|nr:lytic transglycosylase domain-containing protein [Chishuiella sp.]